MRLSSLSVVLVLLAWTLPAPAQFSGGSIPVKFTSCTRDADCSDGVFCNGVERCQPGQAASDARGCQVAKILPCAGGNERCDEDRDACETNCTVTADGDGDGAISDKCGGTDCDDTDPNRYPGNLEACPLGNDGHDEDCNAETFGKVDLDGDGYVAAGCVNTGDTGWFAGNDCDDTRPNIHPNQPESPNGIDDNCDGRVDEDLVFPAPTVAPMYPDADGDGYGSGAAQFVPPGTPGMAALVNDCDDASPLIYPGAGVCSGPGSVKFCASTGQLRTAACETGTYCQTQPSGAGFCVPAKPSPQSAK